MSVKALSSITDLGDLLDYVNAEYDEAVKYCSTAVPYYQTVVSQVASYYNTDRASPYSSVTRERRIADAAYALEAARAIWKSAGCSRGSNASATPDDTKEDSDTNGSVLVPVLLVGAGLLAWLFLRKK